jgi:hypothetical protein
MHLTNPSKRVVIVRRSLALCHLCQVYNRLIICQKVTLLLSLSQSKEELLPKEALRESGNEANFDEEAYNGFDRSKSGIGIA